MLIKSTNLSKARLMDFYQVMTLTSGYLAKEDLAVLKLLQVNTEFETAFLSFDKAIKQAQKTGITDLLIPADDNRDNILIGFTAATRSMLRFPDAEVAQSAARILNISEKYGDGVARLPQREESAVLTNMVNELQNAENAPLLEKTGLTLWVQKLKEANIAFDLLYASRTEKEAEFIAGLTRTERANMQAAFEKLAQAIEAYAFIDGEAPYKTLADTINTEIANVQQATKARASMNKGK